MSMRRFSRQIKKLQSLTPLHKSFNLHENIKIHFQYSSVNDFTVFIECTKRYDFFDILELPEDINKEIYEYYNKEFINISFKYNYRREFPFKSPKLILDEVSSNFPTENIEMFIKYIVKETNVSNGVDKIDNMNYINLYSPAIHMENHLLCLISRLIPVFEYYNLVPVDPINGIERYTTISMLENEEDMDLYFMKELADENFRKHIHQKRMKQAHQRTSITTEIPCFR
tara:strand:- start:266 stop:949 length:684 start_codon:yes stop_codon:yes gene_type:complete